MAGIYPRSGVFRWLLASTLPVWKNVDVRIRSTMEGARLGLTWIISKLRPSPGGTAGQHYKREFMLTTALMPPIIPAFYGARWTGSDSVHWRIIRIPVFPLALGKTRKRGKSMGTAHIGKFDLQEPCGKPRVVKYQRKLPLESRHVLRVWQIYLSPTFRSL